MNVTQKQRRLAGALPRFLIVLLKYRRNLFPESQNRQFVQPNNS